MLPSKTASSCTPARAQQSHFISSSTRRRARRLVRAYTRTHTNRSRPPRVSPPLATRQYIPEYRYICIYIYIFTYRLRLSSELLAAARRRRSWTPTPSRLQLLRPRRGLACTRAHVCVSVFVCVYAWVCQCVYKYIRASVSVYINKTASPIVRPPSPTPHSHRSFVSRPNSLDTRHHRRRLSVALYVNMFALSSPLYPITTTRKAARRPSHRRRRRWWPRRRRRVRGDGNASRRPLLREKQSRIRLLRLRGRRPATVFGRENT